MFRLFITTFQKLPKPLSTQKRKVISQTKNQIQFSPKKYPSQKVPSDLQIYEQELIEGKTYLFHQYQSIKSEAHSCTQSINSEIKLFGTIRSNILAVFNPLKDQINEINQKLKSAKTQIQSVDLIESQNKQMCMVIIFKNLLMCQTFYTYFREQKQILCAYLQSIIIYQQEITKSKQAKFLYSKIMEIYKSQQSLSENYKDRQKKQWIQLPKCAVCLRKLEQQLTGFGQTYLKILSKKDQKHSKVICQTCLTIYQRQSSYQKIKQNFQKGHCNLCKQKEDIWICMICGQLGCGRYKNADAQKHFTQSGHMLALDLQTHRVWNYLADCFSHSLQQKNDYQNQENIVKFPKIQYQDKMIQDTVLQGAFWEYCTIFSQQMQKQRVFYSQIRKKQKQRYQQEKLNLQNILLQLQNEKQIKRANLKKVNKNKYKLQKKELQINLQVLEQKQKLNELEQYLKSQIDLKEIDKDQRVLKKLDILNGLDLQINQLLSKLSQL